MAYSEELADLQDFLAEYVQDPDDIKILFGEANISTARLDELTGNPSDMWFTALTYLDNLEQVAPVVRRLSEKLFGESSKSKQLLALLGQYEKASNVMSNERAEMRPSSTMVEQKQPSNVFQLRGKHNKPPRTYAQRVADEVRSKLVASVETPDVLEPDQALVQVGDLRRKIGQMDNAGLAETVETLADLMDLVVVIAGSVASSPESERNRWSSVFQAIRPACTDFGEHFGFPYHQVMEFVAVFWELEQESASAYEMALAEERAHSQTKNLAVATMKDRSGAAAAAQSGNAARRSFDKEGRSWIS